MHILLPEPVLFFSSRADPGYSQKTRRLAGPDLHMRTSEIKPGPMNLLFIVYY